MPPVDQIHTAAQGILQAAADGAAQEATPPSRILKAQRNRLPVACLNLLGKSVLPIIQAVLLRQLELFEYIHAVFGTATKQSSLLVGITADVVV